MINKISLSPKAYRPDIDGLRAIAVLSVLLFHVNESFLSGGFLGVDIFFVISGYLISSHIFSDIKRNHFSYSDFYRRRINRIMPALYFMVLIGLSLALVFLLPQDLRRAAQSAIEALTFKANIYFAEDYDYFSSSTNQLPFLHLWSLSVEEQFYFALPIFLILLLRLRLPSKGIVEWMRTSNHRPTLMIIMGLSLLYAEFHIYQGNTKTAFYSLPARACELLIGTLLATLILPSKEKGNVLKYEILALISLVFIFLSFFLFDGSTRFPGTSAILLCLASAAIIWTGSANTLVSKALSMKPIVFIGQISYSLYLIHWPLLAIYRYVNDSTSIPLIKSLLIVTVTFFLAIFSWHFIEKPYRAANNNGFAKTFWKIWLIPSGTLIVLLMAITGLAPRLVEIG